MSTASLIALSAQASRCWPCICSANSASRRCSSSGSPKGRRNHHPPCAHHRLPVDAQDEPEIAASWPGVAVRARLRARVRGRLPLLPERDRRLGDPQRRPDGRARPGAHAGAARRGRPADQPRARRGQIHQPPRLRPDRRRRTRRRRDRDPDPDPPAAPTRPGSAGPRPGAPRGRWSWIGGFGVAVVNVVHQIVSAIQAHNFAVGHDHFEQRRRTGAHQGGRRRRRPVPRSAGRALPRRPE